MAESEQPDGAARSELAQVENKAGQPKNADEAELELLREILFSRYRQQLVELEAEIDELERRVADPDELIAILTPVLGNAIRRKIRDAREEMVEALYPIIGSIVVRAVSEAVKDLARNVDAQMRTSFDLSRLWRRLKGQLQGVSGADMALRDSLPFHVSELFLIHRESGLLLKHLSNDPDASPDSDLISGMLTAIRDFTKDSFGQGRSGDLDEIQYGDQTILIEAAQYAYLAVLIEGTSPMGFRATLRERLIEINQAHEETLRDYQGDPSALAGVADPLNTLLHGN